VKGRWSRSGDRVTGFRSHRPRASGRFLVTKPAKTTTTAYRDILTQLWLLDPVPGWVPNRNHLRRLTQAPKHHLADPALAAHLIGVDAGALLRGQSAGPAIPRDGTLLGALFESLVTVSAQVYAQANEATVHHLRSRDGDHEVDLIIERRDQRVVALEVKLDGVPGSSDVYESNWAKTSSTPPSSRLAPTPIVAPTESP